MALNPLFMGKRENIYLFKDLFACFSKMFSLKITMTESFSFFIP